MRVAHGRGELVARHARLRHPQGAARELQRIADVKRILEQAFDRQVLAETAVGQLR
jgi:hypothetical protein